MCCSTLNLRNVFTCQNADEAMSKCKPFRLVLLLIGKTLRAKNKSKKLADSTLDYNAVWHMEAQRGVSMVVASFS